MPNLPGLNGKEVGHVGADLGEVHVLLNVDVQEPAHNEEEDLEHQVDHGKEGYCRVHPVFEGSEVAGPLVSIVEGGEVPDGLPEGEPEDVDD